VDVGKGQTNKRLRNLNGLRNLNLERDIPFIFAIFRSLSAVCGRMGGRLWGLEGALHIRVTNRHICVTNLCCV